MDNIDRVNVFACDLPKYSNEYTVNVYTKKGSIPSIAPLFGKAFWKSAGDVIQRESLGNLNILLSLYGKVEKGYNLHIIFMEAK